ncbi:helix-turn-helix transcriptional regulator [Sulfurimonas xiamenensis]|uniref:Helix-turn-helix domain-containing protein n=1 Tax=Sulfurimonas xiamenensis TaxID=2590021 RepID=A0AAJ4A3L1_9BACT|nr:helix-turn-helix domain-containing protein [Sulfurimonas xiamenensis]QFR43160.1 helix-turn-helix domain-containing protein [Sulfurimonas xiamenensis]
MDFNNSINIAHSLYLDYGYFLTKNNLAEVLGVSLSTIDRRLKEKKLPLHKKIGNRVLFPVSSVANFINNIKDQKLADAGGEL